MKQYLWTAAAILMAVGSATSAHAADSANEILKSYQSAHDIRSTERLGKLVRFRTQDQSHRAAWLKDFTATFSSKIANITLAPFKEFAFVLPDSELKQLSATLKPVNWLAVEFVPHPSPTWTEEIQRTI